MFDACWCKVGKGFGMLWYRMMMSVGGCICGINMAIAPIWCDSAW